MNQYPEDQQQLNPIHYTQTSDDILISKNLLPPALILLPRVQPNITNSLLPMIPLPNFLGTIPMHQPLQTNIKKYNLENYSQYSWIGSAFPNVIYRKYNDTSYQKIDNIQQNWNMWVCDISKLLSQKNEQNNLNAEIKPYHNLKDQNDKTLIFQSRFESGNLSMASKVSDSQYNLLLQNDINTTSYAQWFFFRVSNTTKNSKIKFNILNLTKQNNLYDCGMKIITFSSKQSLQKNISWHRAGEQIFYYQNGYSKSSINLKKFFTLTWSYTFNHSNDQVYFAYNYPFTYTNLDHIIQKLQIDPFCRQIMTRTLLCKTLAKNRVDIITITQQHPDHDQYKPFIIISARVHPGQTVSSYVVNGIMQYLLSSDQKAKKLRQNFIFKIIPMLNPDGVIHGNYRSNLSGYDLNKKWDSPSKSFHPEIYHFKKMILNCHQQSEVVLFCDLHGHSMKKSSFVYGCNNQKDPFDGKQFPFLVSKLFRGFQFKNCCFINPDFKQGTSRSILSKQLDISNVFTLQSSFCGPQYENIHFSIQHFEQLGQRFCQALLLYFEPLIKNKYLQAAINNKSAFEYDSMETVQIRKQYFDELYENRSQVISRINSETSQGSQGQNEFDNIIEQKTIKKFIILETKSISQKKKQRNQQQFKKKIKLVIYKSMSKQKIMNKQQKQKDRYIKQPKQLDLQIQRVQRKQVQSVQSLTRKKKQQSKIKIQIVQKPDHKFLDFQILQKQTQIPIKLIKNTKYNSQSLPRKRLTVDQDNFLNSKLKINSKYQFFSENQNKTSPKKQSIFNNGCLNTIQNFNRQKITSKDIQKKLELLKLEGRGSQKYNNTNKRILQLKIKPRQSTQKLRVNNFVQLSVIKKNPQKNIFKNILDSLKKRK